MRPERLVDFEIRRELENATGDWREALESELANRKRARAMIGQESRVPPIGGARKFGCRRDSRAGTAPPCTGRAQTAK